MRELLLIQIRPAGATAKQHEAECVERRFGERRVRLRTRNAFVEDPELGWLDGVDGVVIGGSGNFSVHDPRSASWVGGLRTLLDTAFSRSIPGFGVCFGHQLMGVHLGADVITDRARMEAGTMAFRLTEGAARDPVFGRFVGRMRGHTGHTDHVMSVPDGATLLASTEQVPVQAFRVEGQGWWTTQFHPDLAHDEAEERFSAFADALEAEGRDRPSSPGYHRDGDEATALLGAWFDEVFDP